MYVKESPAEIESPAHWNLMGSSMTGNCLCYPQQYSSANFVSLQFYPYTEKFVCFFSKKIFQFVLHFKNCVSLNLSSLKLRKSGNVENVHLNN